MTAATPVQEATATDDRQRTIPAVDTGGWGTLPWLARLARLAWLAWPAGLAAALAVAIVVAAAWLDPRFDFLVDDGRHHLLRAGLLDANLRRGVLYPRWWPELTLGYGYPLLNFYSPGVYYLASLFHGLGASTYRSVQLVGVTAVLLGAAGAYVLGAVALRRPLAGLILAVAYAGAPYPFVTNLYNRAAFPEATGLAVLPWTLAAGTLAVQRRTLPAALGLGLALAALVLVHSLTAFVGAGLLLLWVGATLLDSPAAARRAGAQSAALGVALGVALSAFFWLPTLLEQGAVHTGLAWGSTLNGSWWLFDPLGAPPAGAVSEIPERFRASPGPFDLNWFYPHPPKNVPGPVKPSLAQVLFALLSQAGAGPAVAPGEPPAARPAAPPASPGTQIALCLGLGAACWFMNTTWSNAVWSTVPLLGVLQFPWRLYGPFSLALAFAGAGIFAWLARQGQQQWLLGLLLAAFIAVNGRGGHPGVARLHDPATLPPVATQLQDLEGAIHTTASWDGTLSGGEFLPRTVVLPEAAPPGWSWRLAFESRYPSAGWIAGRVWPLDPAMEVRQVWEAPTWTAARVAVDGSAPAEVAFRTLVFPGWRAYVDGRPVPLRPAPYDPTVGLGHGFAIVSVPPGEHDVQLALGSTFWRTSGALVTIAGLGLGLALFLRPWFRTSASWRRLTLGLAAATTLLAVAVLAADLWPAWRAPARPGPDSATIALDLSAAVRDGRGVHIGSPDGGRLGGFVDVRDETIGGHRRRWLYMHPPSEVHVQLDLPPRAVFQTGLGVDPHGWVEPDADGVRFLLEITDAAGARATLLDQVVQPQVHPHDRGWRFAAVDLEAYAGQRVTLTLRTEGRDTPLFDWAGWATPAVYVDRSGRYPPRPSVATALGYVPWLAQQPTP
ncbi:MAG TPA: hypothetical protein VHS99_06050 [Chloroflexota bacterium]|nr:hypothetical protein [Chloroflexota bacterium]